MIKLGKMLRTGTPNKEGKWKTSVREVLRMIVPTVGLALSRRNLRAQFKERIK